MKPTHHKTLKHVWVVSYWDKKLGSCLHGFETKAFAKKFCKRYKIHINEIRKVGMRLTYEC